MIYQKEFAYAAQIATRRKDRYNNFYAQLRAMSTVTAIFYWQLENFFYSALCWIGIRVINDKLVMWRQVFVVGHDWGAIVAWYLCLFRPDRVKALVNLSVCYRARHPSVKPLEGLRALLGDDYYMCRFQVFFFLVFFFDDFSFGCRFGVDKIMGAPLNSPQF